MSLLQDSWTVVASQTRQYVSGSFLFTGPSALVWRQPVILLSTLPSLACNTSTSCRSSCMGSPSMPALGAARALVRPFPTDYRDLAIKMYLMY